MYTVKDKQINTFKLIYKLSKNIRGKRKFQLIFLFCTMVASGLSEITILASLVPFIQFLVNPNLIYTNKLAVNFFEFLNLSDKKDIALLITIFFIFANIFCSV